MCLIYIDRYVVTAIAGVTILGNFIRSTIGSYTIAKVVDYTIEPFGIRLSKGVFN